MLVRFKKDWFGPGEHLQGQPKPSAVVGSGHLYTKTPASAPAVFLPDDYRAMLHPSFATVVDENDQPEVIVPVAEVQTMASADDERQRQEIVDAVVEKAEANRIAGTRKPPRS